MNLSTSVVQTIGGTPMVKLSRMVDPSHADVYVKLESRNPGGAVKDRIAKSMVDDAERKGLIHGGRSVLVEPTSGNTGIALAMVGAARGYRVILTMPDSMSIERRRLLAAYGAKLVLTPGAQGMQGALDAAMELLDSTDNAFMPGQFDNPSNPEAHYRTTGPEIVADLGGTPTAFVAGVGTGGTVSGVGRYLKELDPGVRIAAVEPAESPLITQRLRDEPLKPGPHMIQGIGANFIPQTLDIGILDEVDTVTGEEAIEVARRLAAEEGLLVGISSGANVAAAMRIAARPGMAEGTVVTVAPSTGERYLSTPLWEGLA